jgi:hypothetical protein
LLRRISKGEGVYGSTAATGLHVLPVYAIDSKIVAAGKNFAAFDRQFMRRSMPRFNSVFPPSQHRSRDALHLRGDDKVPPSTG